MLGRAGEVHLVDQVDFHPQSFADPRGRVFFENGTVYRAIYPDSASFYRQFLDTDCFKSLVRDGLLVNAVVTDKTLNGFPLVLMHERIEIASYPYEWCFEALKECALMFLELQERLNAAGLSLHDGHPFNIMFDRCRPVFVDFSSVICPPRKSPWSAYEEFTEFMLNPLILMANGHTKIVRALFARDQGVTASEVKLLAPLEPKASERPTIAQLRSEISSLSFPKDPTDWSAYYDEEFLSLDLDIFPRKKMQGVKDVLVDLKPSKVLDVACNRGWFAQLAARHGAKVIGFDLDEISINLGYLDCKKTGADVQLLVMNINNPSPAIGVMNRGFPDAFTRFRTEMVFALAIVHHLVFKSHLRFEQIIGTLDAFTERWLLIEFIPRDDIHIASWLTPAHDWYSLESLEKELSKFFSRIRKIESDPAPRILLLCER